MNPDDLSGGFCHADLHALQALVTFLRVEWHDDLLEDICKLPDRWDLRLEYAKILKSSNDQESLLQASMIEVAIDLAQNGFDKMQPPVGKWHLLSEAEKILRPHWENRLGQKAQVLEFFAGFPGLVSMLAEDFLSSFESLRRRVPIQYLRLANTEKHLQDVCRSEHLKHLRSLTLDDLDFGDDGAQMIAQSEFFANIRWLSLRRNGIGERGVEALYASANLENLDFLDLYDNPCDPREQYGSDGIGVTARWKTSFGSMLESRYGSRRWMYGFEETLEGWYPSKYFVPDAKHPRKQPII